MGKRCVALISGFTAVVLIGAKIAVGLITGSLGILSKALHSLLDLIAALITFFPSAYQTNPQT
jgi:divalent metal cation (Fe/Co/Zn/Cd) transporter